jgi:hypothetical protein
MEQTTLCNDSNAASDSPNTTDTLPFFDEGPGLSLADYGLNVDDAVPAFLRIENIDRTRKGPVNNRVMEWPQNQGSMHPWLYQRIRPALERVGMMMYNSEFFYAKVIFAEIKHFADPGLHEWTYLDPDFVLPNRGEWEPCADMVRFLSSRVRVFMGPDDEISRVGSHGRAQRHGLHLVAINIHEEYLAFFADPAYLWFSQERKNSVLFSLSVTIMHEIAHAFWLLRRGSERLDHHLSGKHSSLFKRQHEPLFDISDPAKELGHAWEHQTFGGLPTFWYDISGKSAANSSSHHDLLRVGGTTCISWHGARGWHHVFDRGPIAWVGRMDDLVHAFSDPGVFTSACELLAKVRDLELEDLKDFNLRHALELIMHSEKDYGLAGPSFDLASLAERARITPELPAES